MDKDTFRTFGYRFVDWIADYMEGLEHLPVAPSIRPGDIRSRLPKEAPIQGEDMEKIFDDFRTLILPGMTHWQHPSWFAYFPANNSPPSVLAEILTAGMGAQCMIWQTSPAAEELEVVTLDWLRGMLGLPEDMTGVIQDSASSATLAALLTAREKATGYTANTSGIQTPLVVYLSEEAHSSVEKGVKIAGYGNRNLRRIPTDDSFAMIPEELERAVEKDRQSGFSPCCVVATVGTTSSSAIDPLKEIAEICRRRQLWLHVDAAYAGTAAILPEKRWILDGVEGADSFVFNPHKWMLTNFDCSAYFVREPSALIRTFEIHPEYLKTGVDAQVKNFRDWGIPLGRRFRALKLWFVLRSYGIEGIQQMVRRHIEGAGLFSGHIKDSPHFELMAPVPLSLVCFRLNDGRPEEELDELNQTLLERLNASGKLLMTQTRLRGQYVLRLSIGARLTETRHVEEAWQLIDAFARDLITTGA
ncbi:MAG: aminotransferase class I/II-fold pyridoxal phosphate-dependent enzyme [Acidobacteria bacterium]|nr:aminotransferase class I/II-fold pyridoxal phosphate-dependent enzyme [Acidobacteriota bacterium]MBU1339509.1 aminotransferase class I/II-fold pyridoxal phosphate-dependent enzyme [Acidobacteriota bacterium]MBU1474067.1 aminotransferase class I/II-fold pyridoxal phosphate-dependent enzyme [Acidobacteriota bacterium]MBU2438770.1 aminotransferase class I/II-fold pyridoxal phosphate-dependent enzyme [Acidobacteriota bacterium]MBU4331282.1 aminotransferase class I/II-fold pyridoxal phosphate-dep